MTLCELKESNLAGFVNAAHAGEYQRCPLAFHQQRTIQALD